MQARIVQGPQAGPDLLGGEAQVGKPLGHYLPLEQALEAGEILRAPRGLLGPLTRKFPLPLRLALTKEALASPADGTLEDQL
ncbi:MAG: hypothetical protein AAB272_00575, partial [candidate division NC10 bacterium]